MSDLSFRKKSIPFLGQIFGYNRNEASDSDISLADRYGDLEYIANPTTLVPGYGGSSLPQKDNYIRILRPMRSELVGVYLSLALKMDSAEPVPELRISIAKTTSETDLSVISLTLAEILAKHETLRGNSSAFTNTAGQLISINKLDLTPLIPTFGDPDFRSDCFVLGLHFPNTPIAAGFHLYKLEINASALIVS